MNSEWPWNFYQYPGQYQQYLEQYYNYLWAYSSLPMQQAAWNIQNNNPAPNTNNVTAPPLAFTQVSFYFHVPPSTIASAIPPPTYWPSFLASQQSGQASSPVPPQSLPPQPPPPPPEPSAPPSGPPPSTPLPPGSSLSKDRQVESDVELLEEISTYQTKPAGVADTKLDENDICVLREQPPDDDDIHIIRERSPVKDIVMLGETIDLEYFCASKRRNSKSRITLKDKKVCNVPPDLQTQSNSEVSEIEQEHTRQDLTCCINSVIEKDSILSPELQTKNQTGSQRSDLPGDAYEHTMDDLNTSIKIVSVCSLKDTIGNNTCSSQESVLSNNSRTGPLIEKDCNLQPDFQAQNKPCSLCSFSAPDIGVLRKHFDEKHPPSKRVNCIICSSPLANRDYINHIRAHFKNLPYLCQECPYSTKSIYNLVSHFRSHRHAQPKKYRCKNCSFSSDLLLEHKEHSSLHSVACNNCNFSTYRETALERHQHLCHRES